MSLRHSSELAPPHADCVITVVIPARNESQLIGEALAALTRQRALDGQALRNGIYEVIVFANNCSDETAAAARASAAGAEGTTIHVVQGDLPEADAHIGTARQYVMDLAAARLLAAGKPRALIASTDADTVVDPHWIAWTLKEAQAADAVAGQVVIDERDQAQLLAPVRLLYARELAYRRAVAAMEALLDPVPEDPLPRHSSFVGASFAVKAHTYVAAGRLPPLRRLEDFHFCRALRRIDARVRHSPFVRATTSPRVAARVASGFGGFMASLHAQALAGASFSVEHPQQTLHAFVLRAALRRFWQTDRNAAERTLAQRDVRIPPHWRHLLPDAPTFGIFCERVADVTAPLVYPPVSVESATEMIRAGFRPRTERPVMRLGAAQAAR